jgi:hypothetical protein
MSGVGPNWGKGHGVADCELSEGREGIHHFVLFQCSGIFHKAGYREGMQ